MKKFKSGDRIIVTAEHIQSYEQISTDKSTDTNVDTDIDEDKMF